MSTWKSIPLPSCLIGHEVGRWNQINTAEIQPVGRHSVVDQGQAYIAGYTDDASRVITQGLPYIVFGDHTRCFKYIDFPFVLGADGTKVLKPNPDLFDAKFFYYALLALNIPSRGYNRHFTLLKEKLILQPELGEQRRIAALLSAVQQAIQRQERLIALTSELKKALMHKLFTEGTRGEPRKQTEIGPVPASWTLRHIVDLGKCVTGTTPPTKVDEYYSDSAYCFVSPADLGKTKYIVSSERQLSKAGLAAARTLPRDSILCVCIGSSIGKTGMTWHTESCTNQQINAIIANRETNPHFVYYVLTYWAHHWRSHATFGPVPILSKGAFEKVVIPFTGDRAEQDRIADILSAADAKVEHHMWHRTWLSELFRTLLHQIMTAQIRVHDLDLSALENAELKSAGAA